MPRAIGRSAYERQQRIEKQEDFVVGVNCFTGETEIDVSVNFRHADPYDHEHMMTAEQRQLERLAELKQQRSANAVARSLLLLEQQARDPDANLMPAVIECVKSESTVPEICDALRAVFGEAEPIKV